MRISLRRVSPLTRIKLRISRRDNATGNPKNRMKSGHRIKPTIEPEHIFVEVGLQMFGLDAAVMRALDPSLQVAEDEMDHRQMRLGLVRIAAECQGLMAIVRQPRIAGPSVRADDRAGKDIVSHKRSERGGAAVGHDAKAQAPRINLPSVDLFVLPPSANLNGSHDYRLVMNAAPLAARFAADKAFVNFDLMFIADSITFRPDHSSPQFVKNLERGFIAADRKLALELDGGLTGNLRSHEVCAPEPRRQRRVTGLHHGSGRERRIVLTGAATQDYGRPSRKAIRLANRAALWTRESVWPPHGLKIMRTSRIIGEYPLKLGERGREAANVHNRNNSILTPSCQATG